MSFNGTERTLTVTGGAVSDFPVDDVPEQVLQFDVDRRSGCTVLRVDGEIDALTGRLFTERIVEAFDDATGTVVVDLRGVSFFGSPGIAGLVEARNVAERRDLRLRIVCTDRAVLLPLTVTGLLDKFEVHSDLASATS